jgi:membrane-associated HD superfamily phosphohydrolase
MLGLAPIFAPEHRNNLDKWVLDAFPDKSPEERFKAILKIEKRLAKKFSSINKRLASLKRLTDKLDIVEDKTRTKQQIREVKSHLRREINFVDSKLQLLEIAYGVEHFPSVKEWYVPLAQERVK